MRLTAIAALAAALLTAPAVAEDGPRGIAIAQAPEAGFEACHGGNADRTLACARQKCNAAGGDGECLRVRWCFPAGYAGAMSYLANGEITQVTFACGAPSLAGLGGMLSALCAAEPSASECRLVVVWDPDGTLTERDDPLGKNTTGDVAAPPPGSGTPEGGPTIPR